jgi:hypothetical protein
MDLWPVGVVHPFGSQSKGKAHIVGIAIALLFTLEVTFVAVVPTGRSSLLATDIGCFFRLHE